MNPQCAPNGVRRTLQQQCRKSTVKTAGRCTQHALLIPVILAGTLTKITVNTEYAMANWGIGPEGVTR